MMHLYPYSNESFYNNDFAESILLQEIRKIQIEKNEEKYTDGSSYWKWFFAISRRNGGPARFECLGINLPLSLNITYLQWIVAFVVPVIGFCLIIPALRKKAFTSFIVVLMFSSTGLALITGLLTTSWLVGEVEGKMTIGPLKTRCNARVGMWVGLTTLNITLERPNMYLNEIISIHDNSLLKLDQKQAMHNGWPWPLLIMIEYLAGEGKHWTGSLGFYLNRAGRSVYIVLYFSIFLWIVWMYCFTIAAHLASKPLILSGILELFSAIIYAIQIYVYVDPYVIVEGNKLNFSFGWSWWFIFILGCLHTISGVIIFVYDYFRPGKLYTIFEVDFGLPTHRLNIKKINPQFGNENLMDNSTSDDSLGADDYQNCTYESFQHSNDLHPSPDQTDIKPISLDVNSSTPIPEQNSTQKLIQGVLTPINVRRHNNPVKRSILFQHQSTPHKIFVH